MARVQIWMQYTPLQLKNTGDYVKGTEQVIECSSGDVASRMSTNTTNDYHNPTNSTATPSTHDSQEANEFKPLTYNGT